VEDDRNVEDDDDERRRWLFFFFERLPNSLAGGFT
jgi:hypothetical protein